MAESSTFCVPKIYGSLKPKPQDLLTKLGCSTRLHLVDLVLVLCLVLLLLFYFLSSLCELTTSATWLQFYLYNDSTLCITDTIIRHVVSYQAFRSAYSWAWRRNEWVSSSRGDRDVLSQCQRSWNVDTGSRLYTSCRMRQRQVRWAFAPTSPRIETARPGSPGRTAPRHQTLESWASPSVDRRRSPTTPLSETRPRATRSTPSLNCRPLSLLRRTVRCWSVASLLGNIVTTNSLAEAVLFKLTYSFSFRYGI